MLRGERDQNNDGANNRPLLALSRLTVLQRTRAVDELAAAILAAGPLPAKAKADAVHLAMVSVYRLDYLLTWNLKHLANAMIQARLRPVVEQLGSALPLVCTSLQLMGIIEYEG
jgi:hypothetical protein